MNTSALHAKVYFGLTISRWIILFSSSLLLIDGLIALIGTLVTFYHGYNKSIIITIINKDILTAVLCTCSVCLLSGLLGIFAVQRTDRHLLACHTLLLWPCLALVCTVGYLAYKSTVWDLSMKWRYDLKPYEQHLIQEQLRCCGFENSSDHAMYMSSCSQDSLLQGCSEKLIRFEANFLKQVYLGCFLLIPVHLVLILVGLIYSRPSKPWLGRYYGNSIRSPSLDEIKHSHEPSTKPTDHCIACENWTF